MVLELLILNNQDKKEKKKELKHTAAPQMIGSIDILPKQHSTFKQIQTSPYYYYQTTPTPSYLGESPINLFMPIRPNVLDNIRTFNLFDEIRTINPERMTPINTIGIPRSLNEIYNIEIDGKTYEQNIKNLSESLTQISNHGNYNRIFYNI